MYGLDRDVATQRARELMELFELDQRADTLIAGYSKGMKKRVALGAALIHRPSLFLLDEPFEGVDPVGSRVQRQGMTVTGVFPRIGGHPKGLADATGAHDHRLG